MIEPDPAASDSNAPRTEPNNLRAGAGKAEICLPAALFPIDGFTGVHDPLHVRTLLLEGERDRLAIVSIEMTALTAESVRELRELVALTAHLEPQHVLVVATHTFSAPHLGPAVQGGQSPIAHNLLAAAEAATAAARRTLRAAVLCAGTGQSRVAVNRDVQTADGWWLGADDGGPYDADVPVMRIEGLDGGAIAVVFNYAVQSSIMNESIEDDGGRLVTSDLAGAAALYVERHCPEPVVALFLVGAAGDQAPYLSAVRHVLDGDGRAERVDAHTGGHLLVELLGERLGSVVAVAAARAPRFEGTPLRMSEHHIEVDGQVAPGSFRDLRPTTAYAFVPDGRHTVPFWLLEIGPIAMVALQPELSAVTGRALKHRSPIAQTIIVTMANGAAKYLPDAQAYDRMSYEAMSARYARGSAEIVADAIVAALQMARPAPLSSTLSEAQ